MTSVQNPYASHLSGWRGLPSLVQKIKALGRRALPITADVADSAQVDEMVRKGIEQYGHIDILISNAASSHGRDLVPVVDLHEDISDPTVQVNIKGAFLCCRSVAREIIRQKSGGKIIIMSSAVGKRGQACRAAYAAYQIRFGRLHSKSGFGAGPTQNQRQRALSGHGGHGAHKCYGSRACVRRRDR